MNKRAVIYARVSTDVQRDNFSIPSQIAECQQYAQKHGYVIIGDLFVDPKTGLDTVSGNGAIPAYVDDYSSRELSRPSLDASLRYLEVVGFDVLIVHSLDRLARDPYIRQTLEREFQGRNARVEFVLGNYEETPEGEVRKDLDATFSKWENTKRVERSNRGKRRKAENGLFVGGVTPYGYQIDKDAQGGLVIDENEAEVVRRIFYLYVEEGYSLRQIAEVLTQERIPPKAGGSSWGKSSISKIITNTVYIGYCYYNKHKRNGRRLIERDRSDWIRINTPSIVPDWLFEEAQRKLKMNRLISRNVPMRFYMLSGIVFCEECGRPYIAQTAKAGKNRRVNDAQLYRHRAKEGHCTNRQVSARKLEPVIWDEIVSILLDPEKLRRGYEESLEQQEQSRLRYRSHFEVLQRGLVKLKQEQQNLTTLYIDPDVRMSKTEYLDHKYRIEDELRSTEQEIERVKSDLAQIPSPAELETLEIFASRIREKLEGDYDPCPEDKRKVLDLLHVRVFLRLDGGVRIDGWFEEDSTGLSSTTPL